MASLGSIGLEILVPKGRHFPQETLLHLKCLLPPGHFGLLAPASLLVKNEGTVLGWGDWPKHHEEVSCYYQTGQVFGAQAVQDRHLLAVP